MEGGGASATMQDILSSFDAEGEMTEGAVDVVICFLQDKLKKENSNKTIMPYEFTVSIYYHLCNNKRFT